MIIGGSLGAQSINQIIWKHIDKLTKQYNIIHIVGKKNTNLSVKSSNYYQIEFAKDIENYFALSDLVISRAGSNTIFELLAIKKPMILIPLPKSSGSRGDQELNAEYFQQNKYATIITQSDLNIDTLLTSIKHTLNAKNQYISNMNNATNTIGTKSIIELINKNC